jgi:hypothetical protein
MTTFIHKNPSCPPFTKGRNYPSLAAGPRGPLARRAKRGEGRFSHVCVNSILRPLIILWVIKLLNDK